MTSKSRHQVEKEVLDLRREIDKHNYRYYVLKKPESVKYEALPTEGIVSARAIDRCNFAKEPVA